MRSFSWEILDAKSNYISVSVKLAHPELFGQNGAESEYITVQASFSDFEPGW